MSWSGTFILKGTVSQDEFFDAVRKQFAKRVFSIHKYENEYRYSPNPHDTLELLIDPPNRQNSVCSRLWLPEWASFLYAKPLCAIVGPYWTEVGIEPELYEDLEHWVKERYGGFMLPITLPEWYDLEISDEKIQKFYDQLTVEWFAEEYGVTWPPPFPVGNPQVEASYEPDWTIKSSSYETPLKPQVKRPKLGSKRQKPHGKRHERQNTGI